MTDRSPGYWMALDMMFGELEERLGHPPEEHVMERVLERLWTHNPRQLERMRADLHEWFQRRQHSAN
jgi:hypothetical protein